MVRVGRHDPSLPQTVDREKKEKNKQHRPPILKNNTPDESILEIHCHGAVANVSFRGTSRGPALATQKTSKGRKSHQDTFKTFESTFCVGLAMKKKKNEILSGRGDERLKFEFF